MKRRTRIPRKRRSPPDDWKEIPRRERLQRVLAALELFRKLREKDALERLQKCFPKKAEDDSSLPDWREPYIIPLLKLARKKTEDERDLARILAVVDYLEDLPPERLRELSPAIYLFTDALQGLVGIPAPPEPTDTTPPRHPRYAHYERAVLQAYKAGLPDHPIVAEWLETRRRSGDWDALRQARIGLERGVKRLLSKRLAKANPPENAALWKAICRLRKQGKTWAAVLRTLIDQGTLPEISLAAFHARITRLGLRGLKKK